MLVHNDPVAADLVIGSSVSPRDVDRLVLRVCPADVLNGVAIREGAVGFDIACGNKAVRLDMPGSELRANIQSVMDDIWRTLSFGLERNAAFELERRQRPGICDKFWPTANTGIYCCLTGRRAVSGIGLRGGAAYPRFYVKRWTSAIVPTRVGCGAWRKWRCRADTRYRHKFGSRIGSK